MKFLSLSKKYFLENLLDKLFKKYYMKLTDKFVKRYH